MARKGGWRREGSSGRFRYIDARGNRIDDPAKIERIEALVIPPAWKDVWISPRARREAAGDRRRQAGRRQYLYHPEFRAQQDQAKFDKLIRFAERLPELRVAMGEHMTHDALDRERVCAVAVRLINMGWFRVGSDRYAKTSRTYGVTTLTKRHVTVRGDGVTFRFRAQAQAAGADDDRRQRAGRGDQGSARAARRCTPLPLPPRRGVCTLTGAVLNEYIEYIGDEFTAKDFRTWGGTLTAAIALAEHGIAETEQRQSASSRT